MVMFNDYTVVLSSEPACVSPVSIASGLRKYFAPLPVDNEK